MTQEQNKRTASQWFGLFLGIAGVSLGVFMFADIVVPLTQEALQSGDTPHFGLETNLKVMTPIIFGIIGFNMFLRKSKGETDVE